MDDIDSALNDLDPDQAAMIRTVLADDPDDPRKRLSVGYRGDVAKWAMDSQADEPRPALSPPAIRPLTNTPGRRWRFRRNLVIYLAHRRNGLSQRLLADVFDLTRSRIAGIIAEFDRYELAK